MSSTPNQWTVIILAGQRPGTDPVASAFGETYKALVKVAGTPMLTRVASTLLQVPAIGRIVVLGQEPDALAPILPRDNRIKVMKSGRGISDSVQAVAGTIDAPWPVLVTTADHPLLTVNMIEQFIGGATGSDVAVGMVERQTMLARYPDNKRTWRRFRGGAYSGANLFALTSSRSRAALDLWAEAEGDRKKQFGLLVHFGLPLAFRALTRTISLEDGLAKAGRRLGLKAKPVILDEAEAAIDVDKPSDHALVEQILAGRA